MTATVLTTAAPTPLDTPTVAWPRRAVPALLAATAVFWSIGLSRNGFANEFYSAAVQAGTKSWTAFLFGSSDAGNSITVDKPPAALWPMEISARIFGVNSWSILLPQVLLGVAAVGLLYVVVKRQFGPAAGIAAGLVLALTPVATLMFRYNNPDALLVLVMIAAAWALMRAVEDGRTRWLLACGALLGLGFLTKQLQVMLVVPGLALAYLVAGPPRWPTRLWQLLAGFGALAVAAGWWVALVELLPASARPYVGGSTDNSFLDLTFAYNGMSRITGGEHGMPRPKPPSGNGPGPHFGTDAGWARMFSGEAGGQISCLLPAALVFLVAGIVLCAHAARTDARRAQYLLWGGWLLVTGAIFSFMSGIFHDYYTVALAPAVAALVGIGVTQLWQRRHTRWVGALVVLTIAVSAVWSWTLLGRADGFVPPLRWAVLTVGVAAAVTLAVTLWRPNLRRVAGWAAAAAAVVALAGPLAFSIATVTGTHNGGIVLAGPRTVDMRPPDPNRDGGPPDRKASAEVSELLDVQADSFTWVAATNGANEAAGYQLATDDPVMPIGGFMGSDPSPTLEQFQAYVAGHRIHYYLASREHGPGHAPFPGRGESQATRIAAWVKATFTPVQVDGVTVYDLTAPKV